jgi:hypothetical protein
MGGGVTEHERNEMTRQPTLTPSMMCSWGWFVRWYACLEVVVRKKKEEERNEDDM